MVPYAIDTDSRVKVIFGLAIAALSVTAFLTSSLPADFLAPSAMGVFGLMYLLVDKVVWKIPFIQKFHGIPNLNGVWKGHLDRQNAKADNIECENCITLYISQTWSKIEIILEYETNDPFDMTGNTRSFVRAASFQAEGEHTKFIRYIWEYKEGYGICELKYSEEKSGKSTLKGPYISSRMIEGEFKVERVQT